MRHDILYRLMLPDLGLRAYAADTFVTAQSICSAHDTTPNATSALSKAISVAALMSATLKPDSGQSLSVKIQGSGPLKEIHVQADTLGDIRGYVKRPRVDEDTDIGGISFPKAIGAGLLTVTKDIGMKEPYSGVTHFIKGELAIDTAYYLTSSEQVPSAVILAATLDKNGSLSSSGGILIQTFPGTPDTSIALVESKLSSEHENLGEALVAGKNLIKYLTSLLDGTRVDINGSITLRHSCKCSRERIETIVGSLERADIEEMIEKDGGAEIHCTFCNRKYTFSKSELTEMLRKSAK
jgi:molecular chaperone Hsp33